MTPAENLAHAIAATFATQPQRVGREWRCMCPVHEADGGVHRPSLAIWDRPSGYGFKCLTGCSRASVRDALASRGVSIEGGQSFKPADRAAQEIADEQRRVSSLMTTQQILAESLPPARGGPVWTYLTSRHLKVYDSLECVLEHDTGLVGAICDLSSHDPWSGIPDMRVTGCSVLSLTKAGSPRMQGGKKFRTIHGTSRGYGVPFGRPGRRMVVAEGIETMIAAMELLDVGFGAACLSAANMPNLVIPAWVDSVTISADNDQAGLDAMTSLTARLHAVGVMCDFVAYGDAMTGFDAADELMKRKTSDAIHL